MKRHATRDAWAMALIGLGCAAMVAPVPTTAAPTVPAFAVDPASRFPRLAWAGIDGMVKAPALPVAHFVGTRVAAATATATGVPGAAAQLASPASAGDSDEPIRALLLPPEETTLSSPIAGTITRMRAHLGSRVLSKGVVVEYECSEPLARLGMAKAELSGAVETHEAKVRMHGLEQASDVEVALAAAAVAKARSQIEMTKSQIAQCTLLAPWDGRVAKLHARQHMTVTPGQPLMDLVRSGALKLKVNAPSRWLGQLKAGQALRVTVDETGRSYVARITRINSRVDPASQTVEVEALLGSAYAELLPGMSGVVALRGTP